MSLKSECYPMCQNDYNKEIDWNSDKTSYILLWSLQFNKPYGPQKLMNLFVSALQFNKRMNSRVTVEEYENQLRSHFNLEHLETLHGESNNDSDNEGYDLFKIATKDPESYSEFFEFLKNEGISPNNYNEDVIRAKDTRRKTKENVKTIVKPDEEKVTIKQEKLSNEKSTTNKNNVKKNKTQENSNKRNNSKPGKHTKLKTSEALKRLKSDNDETSSVSSTSDKETGRKSKKMKTVKNSRQSSASSRSEKRTDSAKNKINATPQRMLRSLKK